MSSWSDAILPKIFGALNLAEYHVPWADQTSVHPIGLLALAICGIAICVVRRRYAIIPLLLVTCFIPMGQRVVVAGIDFTFLRIAVMFGWIRILMRREYFGLQLKTMDRVLLAWGLAFIVIYPIQWKTFGSLVYVLGQTFDALGIYFFARCMIRSWDDLDRIIVGFMAIAIPCVLLFWVEKLTTRNMFSIFGGVPENTIIRKGRIRCQGAFRHPILAGCFWASLVPLFAAYWYRGTALRGTVFCLGCVGAIVIASASSTPLMMVALVIPAAMAWRLRFQMKTIRRVILFMIIAVHFIRERPVWHLISRIDLIGGSTGHHRYRLIDAAIRNWNEWFLIGNRGTAHWGWGLNDVTNHYIKQAVDGGIIVLALFLATIVVAFRSVGRIWRSVSGHRYRQMLAWALGISIFQHAMAFTAVTYFGQIVMIWYLGLATITSLEPRQVTAPAHPLRAPRPQTQRSPVAAAPVG